jgi:hypothetical protein
MERIAEIPIIEPEEENSLSSNSSSQNPYQNEDFIHRYLEKINKTKGTQKINRKNDEKLKKTEKLESFSNSDESDDDEYANMARERRDLKLAKMNQSLIDEKKINNFRPRKKISSNNFFDKKNFQPPHSSPEKLFSGIKHSISSEENYEIPQIVVNNYETVNKKEIGNSKSKIIVLISGYEFTVDFVKLWQHQSIEFCLGRDVPLHAEHLLVGKSEKLSLNFISPLLQVLLYYCKHKIK